MIFPLSNWRIQPQELGYTNAKTAYGFATFEGRILVNKVFIGTQAYQQLDNTIRHELAHLAVGLEEQHNARFRRMEREFGVVKRAAEPSELEELRNALIPKYTLFARLTNGEIKNLGGAHRRHKKYTQYRKRRFQLLTVDGVIVDDFFYQMNSQ